MSYSAQQHDHGERIIKLLERLVRAIRKLPEELMKGTFQVVLTVEPAPPPALAVTTPEDLGPVGGPLVTTSLGISGGTPPYSVAFTGALPPGVSMDATGAFTGTPSSAGTFPISVDVTDANG